MFRFGNFGNGAQSYDEN